jgi:hypothetical protein
MEDMAAMLLDGRVVRWLHADLVRFAKAIDAGYDDHAAALKDLARLGASLAGVRGDDDITDAQRLGALSGQAQGLVCVLGASLLKIDRLGFD